MVEQGKDCRSVVTQLSAVSSAVDKAGFAIIATAMKECIAEDGKPAKDGDVSVEDLEKLFLSLSRKNLLLLHLHLHLLRNQKA